MGKAATPKALFINQQTLGGLPGITNFKTNPETGFLNYLNIARSIKHFPLSIF
jgi:hypothetical protein